MSRVPAETRTGSDAGRAWRRDVDQWRNSVQRSLSEALSEMRELAENIEFQAQLETARAGRMTTVPSSAVATPANVGAKTARATGAITNGALSDRNSMSSDDDMLPAATQPPSTGGNSATSEDRLAELARRLEEKLERSSSRANDGRLQER